MVVPSSEDKSRPRYWLVEILFYVVTLGPWVAMLWLLWPRR